VKEHRIQTRLGQISVAVDERGTDIPLVFMHGVFLDKSLWADCSSSITGRTHIYIDMPAHGVSGNVGHDWSLNDCVEMFMHILNELGITRCIVIGHSWGSMTALRAASRYPSHFAALGLFNMPFKRSVGMGRLAFTLQKLMTGFPRFYAKQAAKSLYTKQMLSARPEFSVSMQERLAKRPSREISRVIDAVILNAEDATHLLNILKVPALAIIGESDYVGVPPSMKTVTVPGGHISPHEAPAETRLAIEQVLKLATLVPNNQMQPTGYAGG